MSDPGSLPENSVAEAEYQPIGSVEWVSPPMKLLPTDVTFGLPKNVKLSLALDGPLTVLMKLNADAKDQLVGHRMGISVTFEIRSGPDRNTPPKSCESCKQFVPSGRWSESFLEIEYDGAYYGNDDEIQLTLVPQENHHCFKLRANCQTTCHTDSVMTLSPVITLHRWCYPQGINYNRRQIIPGLKYRVEAIQDALSADDYVESDESSEMLAPSFDIFDHRDQI